MKCPTKDTIEKVKLLDKGINIILKWKKLNSVNNMYVRTSSGIALSNNAKTFKKEAARQVRVQLPKVFPFNNKDFFKLTLHFVLGSRFTIRDTSNFIKLIEDVIFDELHINDARNVILTASKSLGDKKTEEYIYATIEALDSYDYKNYLPGKDYLVKGKTNGVHNINIDHIKNIEKNGGNKLFTVEEVNKLLLKQYIMINENNLSENLDELVVNRGINKIK